VIQSILHRHSLAARQVARMPLISEPLPYTPKQK
jgi:hypothetical protein